MRTFQAFSALMVTALALTACGNKTKTAATPQAQSAASAARALSAAENRKTDDILLRGHVLKDAAVRRTQLELCKGSAEQLKAFDWQASLLISRGSDAPHRAEARKNFDAAVAEAKTRLAQAQMPPDLCTRLKAAADVTNQRHREAQARVTSSPAERRSASTPGAASGPLK